MGSQHQQMSQPYLQSQHHLESQQPPGLAASFSPMHFSCSTMKLRASSSSQSSHTARISSPQFCTQYDIDAHQSSKSEPPDVGPTHSANYSWQRVKKRKRTHPSLTLAPLGLQFPFNSQNSFAELSHLPDDNVHDSTSSLLRLKILPTPHIRV
jgi:hypothetical protein